MTEMATETGSEFGGVTPEAAATMWLAACPRGRLESERVSLAAGLGRVTTEPVWARRSSPAEAIAATDGIAVRSRDTTGAAANHRVRLVPRQFDPVEAGAPFPPSRDAVIARELVECGGDGRGAWIAAPAAPGQHVHAAAEDVAAGELLFTAGHCLRAADLALAAAAGATELVVRRRARVAILATGDELRPPEAPLGPGELADTSSLMLDGQAREAGCVVERGAIIPDDTGQLEHALLEAVGTADLVIVVAGRNAVRPEHLPEVLRRDGQVVVRSVEMRPGRPAVLGVVRGTPVLVCPACAASAALAFDALAVPVLAAFAGVTTAGAAPEVVDLATTVRVEPGTRELVHVRLASVEGRRVAVPLRRGTGVLRSLARADARLSVRPSRRELAAGTSIEVGRMNADACVVLVAGAPDPELDRLVIAHPGVGLCELTPTQAVALVRAGRCHAAAFSGVLEDHSNELETVRLTDVDVVLAGGPELRPGHRVAVAPHGTAARGLLQLTGEPRDVVTVRSDAAAFAAFAAGHADFALGAAAAAPPGLRTTDFGRAPLDLVVRRGAADRDPALHALLETVSRLRRERDAP